MSSVHAPSFESHLEQAVQSVRGALTDLIASVGADPQAPQMLARRFGLNKNLTWKVSRIIAAHDAFSAIRHMPGATGMEIFVNALEHAGASAHAVAATREAMREFDRVIDVHTGDRATLDLVLDSMGVGGDSGQLELSRKLAYRGNSGIWGVQARVKSTIHFLAPAADDPDRIDVALVGGFAGFRRLRPGATWPLFRVGHYNDDGTPLATDANHEEAIEPDYDDVPGLKLIPSFCSGTIPEITSTSDEFSTSYELGAGPVGNKGVFDCFFGSITRSYSSRYRDESNEFCEFFSLVSAPVETLLFDIIAHRDLDFVRDPSLSVYARPSGTVDFGARRDQSTRLPIAEPLIRLGSEPPIVATPLVPRHSELVQRVFDRAGWDPREFFGIRLVLKYPPMPSMVVLSSRLPERP